MSELKVTPSLLAANLSNDEVAIELGMAQSWQAMARVLLDGPEVAATSVAYLRGMGRIGLSVPDWEAQPAEAKDLHDHIMATLARFGLEPLSEEEVVAEMNSAMSALARAQSDA